MTDREAIDDAFECARAALFVASDQASIRHILDVLRDRLAATATPAAAQADSELPEWHDVCNKAHSVGRGELSPLELFILDNEPAGTDDENTFRTQLAAVLATPAAAQADAVIERYRLAMLGYPGDDVDASYAELVAAKNALRAALATPAAAEAPAVSWDWLRGVIKSIPSPRPPLGIGREVPLDAVLSWVDEAERRAALATPQQPAAPVQQEGKPLTDEQIAGMSDQDINRMIAASEVYGYHPGAILEFARKIERQALQEAAKACATAIRQLAARQSSQKEAP